MTSRSVVRLEISFSLALNPLTIAVTEIAWSARSSNAVILTSLHTHANLNTQFYAEYRVEFHIQQAAKNANLPTCVFPCLQKMSRTTCEFFRHV
jgi:hypothetical protein